eukprot:TRINITY_DN4124_c0_g7_i1.p1 TRINITY_DN4124_c0_g7~~TRINITY_DN4124_c0_g7_i1.p1  ORF type:complete len:401 (+),score=79.17 TRINITY_DN4124_c0_g7_i1:57-1259(+)
MANPDLGQEAIRALQDYFAAPLAPFVHLLQDRLTELQNQWAPPIYRLVKRLILLAIAMCVLVVVLFAMFLFSLVLYSIGYYIFIPTIHINKPVYFDYSVGRYAITRPTASVRLVGKQWSHSSLTQELYVEGSSALAANQAYNIMLRMRIPDSPVNHDYGLVQVHANIYDVNGKLLGSSSRPLAIKYTSWVVRAMKHCVFWAPYLLGWMVEEQELALPLFDHFFEHSEHRAVSVNVTLSQALQVYEAQLHFHTQLQGFRYYVYHWFFSSLLVFVGHSMAVQVFGLLVVLFLLRNVLYQLFEPLLADQVVVGVGMGVGEPVGGFDARGFRLGSPRVSPRLPSLAPIVQPPPAPAAPAPLPAKQSDDSSQAILSDVEEKQASNQDVVGREVSGEESSLRRRNV